jgi:hypothetical protein
MTNRKLRTVLAGLAVLALSAGRTLPAGSQAAQIKEKPPMYSYIAIWNIPRAQWAARENQAAAARKILDRAIANGTISAYGFDGNPLHDTFWLALSRAGLEKVRDEFQKAGIAVVPSTAGAGAPPPVSILVSRYYNWRAITCKNAYVHVGIYRIKADAPSNVVDLLSRNFFAPPLEKSLAGGAIFEWETDTYAEPKDGPGTFLIAYLSATAEGLEKAKDAVQETLKAKPSTGPAFGSLVDVNASRDVVVRSYAVYK